MITTQLLEKLALEMGGENGFLSGEQLSKELGVSRMTVSNAIRALREDGYEIESVTGCGHRLLTFANHLNEATLAAFLPKQRIEKICCFEELASTNQTLRDLAYEGAPDGQVVIAAEQTAGRGRRGRSFYSPQGKGLYFSYLVKPDSASNISIEQVPEITAWTAVAVVRTIQKLYDVTPGIKWVNDLLLGEKKVCGILTEMFLEAETASIDSIIIGIGINVSHKAKDFPRDLKSIATSLEKETGLQISRTQIAAALTEEMDRMRSDWPEKKAEYLAAYKSHCMTLGKEVVIHRLSGDGDVHAEAVGISKDFSLQVRYPDGRKETISSGEVSIRAK